MYEVSTSTPYHDAIGVRIGFGGRAGPREPADRQARVDDTHLVSMLILDGLTIAGHHIAGILRRVEVHVGIGPARLVEQHGHQIPFHIEILVAVVATLYGLDAVTVDFGIRREIPAPFLEIIRFEGDRAVVEVGVVLQHAPAIGKHGVGLVDMPLCEPGGHVGCHLHSVQDALDAQRGLVEYLGSVIDSLLANGITRLDEQETECNHEDDGSKQNHPQAT